MASGTARQQRQGYRRKDRRRKRWKGRQKSTGYGNEWTKENSKERQKIQIHNCVHFLMTKTVIFHKCLYFLCVVSASTRKLINVNQAICGSRQKYSTSEKYKNKLD